MLQAGKGDRCMSTQHLLASMGLFILGLWWCKEIAERFPGDLAAFRHPNRPGIRYVILFFWGVTILIVALMILSVWKALEMLRTFFV